VHVATMPSCSAMMAACCISIAVTRLVSRYGQSRNTCRMVVNGAPLTTLAPTGCDYALQSGHSKRMRSHTRYDSRLRTSATRPDANDVAAGATVARGRSLC
jgi:hypothetical protein